MSKSQHVKTPRFNKTAPAPIKTMTFEGFKRRRNIKNNYPEDKGLKDGRCNRSGCLRPLQGDKQFTMTDHETFTSDGRLYYCYDCAAAFTRADREFGAPIRCTEVKSDNEPTMTQRIMFAERSERSTRGEFMNGPDVIITILDPDNGNTETPLSIGGSEREAGNWLNEVNKQIVDAGVTGAVRIRARDNRAAQRLSGFAQWLAVSNQLEGLLVEDQGNRNIAGHGPFDYRDHMTTTPVKP